MKKNHYPEEKGEMTILGRKMRWTLRRSMSGSAFGLRGSRIFSLKLYEGEKLIGEYDRGWVTQPYAEDEAASCCLGYLLDKFGREKKIKRKEKMGNAE